MEPVGFSINSYDTYYSGNHVERFRQYMHDKVRIDYGAGLMRDAINHQTEALTESINAASERQREAILTVGNQVSSQIEASTQTIVSTIKEAEAAICQGLNNISSILSSLNRRVDLINDQLKMTNLLLGNVIDLLKIPDSEKERQQAISLAIKYFVNAHEFPELYEDALEYFLKAEKLQPQDFFVLHRIGCIYLYVDYLMDPAKALSYFTRAAKYAEADSSINAIRIANLLTDPINSSYVSIGSDPSKVSLLAADSYEKAAFAAYVDNEIGKAIQLQKKAVSLDNQPDNIYNLAKYFAHNGETAKAIILLNIAIKSSPKFAIAIFQDYDFITNQEIIRWIKDKNDSLDNLLITISNNTRDPDISQCVKNELDTGSFISKCRIVRRVLKLDKTLQ